MRMDEIISGNGSVVDPRLLERLNGKRAFTHSTASLPTSTNTPPVADPNWHPIATRLFEMAFESENVALFEASDWSICVILAESVNRELTCGGTPRMGSMTGWTQVLADLDATVARRNGLS